MMHLKQPLKNFTKKQPLELHPRIMHNKQSGITLPYSTLREN